MTIIINRIYIYIYVCVPMLADEAELAKSAFTFAYIYGAGNPPIGPMRSYGVTLVSPHLRGGQVFLERGFNFDSMTRCGPRRPRRAASWVKRAVVARVVRVATQSKRSVRQAEYTVITSHGEANHQSIRMLVHKASMKNRSTEVHDTAISDRFN